MNREQRELTALGVWACIGLGLAIAYLALL